MALRDLPPFYHFARLPELPELFDSELAATVMPVPIERDTYRLAERIGGQGIYRHVSEMPNKTATDAGRDGAATMVAKNRKGSPTLLETLRRACPKLAKKEGGIAAALGGESVVVFG